MKYFLLNSREKKVYIDYCIYIYIYIPFKEIKNYMEIILTPNKDIF